MPVAAETWVAFRNFMVGRKQMNPNSTVPERLRKLHYAENHGLDLENFTEDAVYSWLAARSERGCRPTSNNHYIRVFNLWSQFRNLPFHFKEYREYAKPIRVPTAPDVRAMVLHYGRQTSSDRRNRLMLVFLAMTGLRAAELCDLVLDDIDYRSGAVIVRCGKGMKSRTVPVKWKLLVSDNFPCVRDYVEKWRIRSSSKYLFTMNKGKMTTAFLRKIVKDAGRKVGIPWMHPHLFRHYAAVSWLRAGIDVATVQQLLGHSSVATTSRYLHATDAVRAIREAPIEDVFAVGKTKKPVNHLMLDMEGL
ncbi:MAG: tyrosine-type recombinase/integrase [Candidatus Thermoplasmatota archaeon]|nr:tyrosine-type recombinase/integrase [Candidatus Thermoplasmatota archaeon]